MSPSACCSSWPLRSRRSPCRPGWPPTLSIKRRVPITWPRPAADPVYERIESSLHLAIEGYAEDRPARCQQTAPPQPAHLREPTNERAAAKKIEMFNQHELPIFLRVGLAPVLFGQTILGTNLPNLTYMLVFPDDTERGAAWKRFGGDDDWKKLKAMPEYADKEIVSKITNKISLPSPTRKSEFPPRAFLASPGSPAPPRSIPRAWSSASPRPSSRPRTPESRSASDSAS